MSADVLPFGPSQAAALADEHRKAFARLQAELAYFLGYRVDVIADRLGFRIARNNFSLDVPDLGSLAEFARRVGIE